MGTSFFLKLKIMCECHDTIRKPTKGFQKILLAFAFFLQLLLDLKQLFSAIIIRERRRERDRKKKLYRYNRNQQSANINLCTLIKNFTPGDFHFIFRVRFYCFSCTNLTMHEESILRIREFGTETKKTCVIYFFDLIVPLFPIE